MAHCFRWDGDAMHPVRRKLADETFVCGQTYWLEVENPRNMLSHREEFAWLKEAWMQLPESVADQFPTPEHLRKRALVHAGFYYETIIDAGTQAAALRVAAYARGENEFAVVVTRGPLVVVRKPKSQSVRAMGGKDFQRSKDAIKEIVANLIGVSPDTLQREAGKAA